MTSIVDLNNRYTNLLRHYPMIIESSDPDLPPRELSISHPVVEDLKFVKTFRPFYKYYAKKGFIKQGVIERLGLRDLKDPKKIHFYRSTTLNLDDNNDQSVSIPDVVNILKMIVPSRNENWKIFPTLLRDITVCKNLQVQRHTDSKHTADIGEVVMTFLDHFYPERNEFCYINDVGKIEDVCKYYYEETNHVTYDIVLEDLSSTIVTHVGPEMEPWLYNGYPVDIKDIRSLNPDFSNTMYSTFSTSDEISIHVDPDQPLRSGGKMSDEFYETLLVSAGTHRFFKVTLEEVQFIDRELLVKTFDIVKSAIAEVPPFKHIDIKPLLMDMSWLVKDLLAQCAIILRNIGVANNTEFPMMSVSLCITLEEDVLVKIETDTINVVWHYDLKLYKLIPPVLEHGTLSFD